MKKSLIKTICISVLIFQGIVVSLAQTVVEIPPVVDEHVKKIADPKDHIVADFDYDGYLHLPDGIKAKPYSLGGNAYVMWDYPVGYGPFSIALGIGFSTHDLHTNGRITYSIDGKYTSFVPINTKYSTNKFSCNYIDIPIELRIRARGNHKFKLAVGGKVGYAYNVHTKFADDDGKIKVYRIKNIDPLRYGVTFRIGYDRYNIQAFYGLSELFVKGHGEPNMVPFTLGIGMLFY